MSAQHPYSYILNGGWLLAYDQRDKDWALIRKVTPNDDEFWVTWNGKAQPIPALDADSSWSADILDRTHFYPVDADSSWSADMLDRTHFYPVDADVVAACLMFVATARNGSAARWWNFAAARVGIVETAG